MSPMNLTIPIIITLNSPISPVLNHYEWAQTATVNRFSSALRWLCLLTITSPISTPLGALTAASWCLGGASPAGSQGAASEGTSVAQRWGLRWKWWKMMKHQRWHYLAVSNALGYPTSNKYCKYIIIFEGKPNHKWEKPHGKHPAWLQSIRGHSARPWNWWWTLVDQLHG